MRTTTFILASFFTLNCTAQVQVNKPIEFTSTTADERQVLNVGTPNLPTDGVSLKAYRNGSLTHGIAIGTNNISVDLFPDAQSYSNGLMLTFLAENENTDLVSVNVDGLGATPVLRPDGLPLDPSDILAGEVLMLTYLDGNFILRSRTNSSCPSGAVQVNESYCIDLDESGPESFYNAATDCHDRGGRLCKWDEHFYACQRTDLGLQGLMNNWEWMDDTSDHTHTVDQVNRWACTSQRGNDGNSLFVESEYRCCFTLR